MPPSSPVPLIPRRELWAWASLDFANSGYTTVVLTAVFNAYFVSVIMANQPEATLVWTLLLSLSYVLVMVTAPLLGAYADSRARRRWLLYWATGLCLLGTLGLVRAGPGDVLLVAVCLVVSNLAYATHQDLTAAFLTELAPPERYGRLSGYGWAWGYLGGLVSLILALAWVQAGPQVLGLVGEPTPSLLVGGSLVLTAAVFGLVGFWALAHLQERSPPTGAAWWRAWHRLAQGWRGLSVHPQALALRRLLAAVAVYQAGVAAVITLAAIYAQQVMGFDLSQTILLVLVVNITASLGAAFFGLIQDRLGHRRSLALSLLVWILMVLVAALATTEPLFWLAANLAGLAMGSSQSGARAAVAALAPEGQQAEAFGYWGVAVHLASVLGPLVYGLASWFSGNDHRLAMLVTGLFFVVGLILILRVPFPARPNVSSQEGPDVPSESA